MSFYFKYTANFHTNLSSALSKSVMYPSKSVIKYEIQADIMRGGYKSVRWWFDWMYASMYASGVIVIIITT